VAASGAPVGGLLAGFSWRWIFLINVPIGLVTILAGLRVLPEIRAERGTRLPDPLSAVTLLAAITLLTLATGLRIARHPRAIVEPALLHSREFTAAAIALFLFFIAFAAWLLITVLFLQDLWHYSALRAGLAIAPGPLTAAVFAVNSGRITGRVGRVVPAAGSLLIAASGGRPQHVPPARQRHRHRHPGGPAGLAAPWRARPVPPGLAAHHGRRGRRRPSRRPGRPAGRPDAAGSAARLRRRDPAGIHSRFIRCPHFVHRTGGLSAYRVLCLPVYAHSFHRNWV
jgi:hypothetical protein